MRIAIIEDKLPLLENLRLLLDGEEGITVVGAYAGAKAALEGLRKDRPDLALVDLGLPDMDGVELIERIKVEFPETDIMVYSVLDDRGNVFPALKAGAAGYILKGTTPRELVEAIRGLHEGGAPMSPKIAKMVLREFQGNTAADKCGLSVRELEILKGMDHGLTYRELAEKLYISPQTVRTHIKNIYRKLHARNKTEALHKFRTTAP